MPPSIVENVANETGAIAIIVATVILYIQGKRNNAGTQQKLDRTMKETVDVKANLTETNGGSHAKDQFNRIEKSQEDTHKRTERIETRQDRADRRMGRLESRFDDMGEKIDSLRDALLEHMEDKKNGKS